MNKNSMVDFDKNNIYADIVYYAVFCTYRRRKVFFEDEIFCRFTELVTIYLKEMRCELLSLTVEVDHVVLSIKANASLSPISVFFTLRHNTSSVLRQEFELLKKTSALWGRGLLLSTKPIEESVYLGFLEGQKRKVVKKLKNQ